jgi:hypothetical protein
MFQAVETHIDEFLSIHLHSDVCRRTARLLVCEAKVFWVVFPTIGHLQEREHPHPLVERIVNDHSAFMFHDIQLRPIVSGEQRVPERWNVVHLLDNRVHVADAA